MRSEQVQSPSLSPCVLSPHWKFWQANAESSCVTPAKITMMAFAKISHFCCGVIFSVGGAMPNRPKNKNCPITMKFGDIVGFALIKK